MNTYDLIPDIHGQSSKLDAVLAGLGWQRRNGDWHHSDQNRHIVFLGDFIDRGPNNRSVLNTVRTLIDAGKASAIMGNHELNALHFHTLHPEDGQPLRDRSSKNTHQHQAFLDEFPLCDPQTRDALDWMHGLPLFLEIGGFRAVHACWNEPTIDRLKSLTKHGVLSQEQLIEAASRNSTGELFNLVEQTAKGPDHPLPEGWSYTDKNGTLRDQIRLKWWQADAQYWRDIAISVPSLDNLPDTPLPETMSVRTYPKSAPPVFFGHYWLNGKFDVQAPNALCLDYSAGKDGPLVSYTLTDPAEPLSVAKIRRHAAVS